MGRALRVLRSGRVADVICRQKGPILGGFRGGRPGLLLITVGVGAHTPPTPFSRLGQVFLPGLRPVKTYLWRQLV